MKKTLFIALMMLKFTFLIGQTSYIEVKGEPNLSVYLNNNYKGKTTAEFNGLIIENVNSGNNLIKIVKEGFTPFEETISVKPGEVLAYKVKPFTKHVVHVSEQGNTEETSKTATIKTGKLIIQSVPIEIKITIPSIEGIDKSAKTKDKWLAEEIPAGSYKITFTYNQKVITKTVEVIANETTSLFVNMLSGDFKNSNSLDERNAQERADYLKYHAVSNFIDSLCTTYKYKPGLSKSEFRVYNTEAGILMNSREIYASEKNYTMGNSYRAYGNEKYKSNVNDIDFRHTGTGLYSYTYKVIWGKGKDIGTNAIEYYNKMKNLVESTIPKEFIKIESDGRVIVSEGRRGSTSIDFYYHYTNKNEGSFNIHFSTF